MAEIDVVAYLASKGKHGKAVSSGHEIAYACFFDCDEPEHSKKKKLYVNPDEGFYSCKVCGTYGGTYLLQKHFGDTPEKPLPGSDPLVRRKILDWATEAGSVMLTNNDEQLLYLMNERGLTPETIVERKLGFVGGRWSLIGSVPETFTREDFNTTGLVYRDGPRAGQDFFYNHILIPYVTRGHTVQVRGRFAGNTSGGKYMTGPGEPVRIYNTDSLEGAEDVIITEGEFDAMVVAQHLAMSPEDRVRNIAVIGLAGANGFKETDAGLLAGAKRVYLGYDPDDTGRREAIKVKEFLGSRARIIELPDTLPKCDWTEYLLPVQPDASDYWHSLHPYAGHNWQDVVSLLGNASGKRLFTLRESGHSWRTERDSDRTSIKTGYIGLDETIEGMRPGQVMVVLAKTGAGKTIFLCNLAYNMRHHKVLFVSLEMTREEVYERLRRIYLFYTPRATDSELEHAMSNILICDENRLDEGDLTRLVSEYEMETGDRPEVVMVDYLGYYARGQKGSSNYEKVTNAVMQLKAEAKAGRYVCITPAQVNRLAKDGRPVSLDDARDSGAIEETADFLLSLYRPDSALTADQVAGDDNTQMNGRVILDLLKSRHGGKGTKFTLVNDLLSLVMVDHLTPNANKAESHNRMCWQGAKWEDLHRAETAPEQMEITTYRRDLQ